MEKLILKSCVLVLAFSMSLAACSKQEEENVSGLESYTTVNDQFKQKDAEVLDGTGIVRFTSTLPGLVSNKAVQVRGTLNPNGSLAIVMNSDDMSLSDGKGVIFQFTRGSDVLSGQISSARILVQGAAVNLSAQRLAYINALDFELIVEVHNTQTTTRVLVWRKEVGTYSLANVEIDSNVPSHLTASFPGGSGQGVFAGLKLTNAKVTTAQIGDAKVTLP